MKIEMTTVEFGDLFGAGLGVKPETDHLAKAIATYNSGQKLQAIKDIRDAYGFESKQAKDLIALVTHDTDPYRKFSD